MFRMNTKGKNMYLLLFIVNHIMIVLVRPTWAANQVACGLWTKTSLTPLLLILIYHYTINPCGSKLRLLIIYLCLAYADLILIPLALATGPLPARYAPTLHNFITVALLFRPWIFFFPNTVFSFSLTADVIKL